MEKVSLYIPVYNGARYLRKTLEAVFAQTVPFDEILVVDDASTDATPHIAKAYPVELITLKEHRGIGATRNTGVAHCVYSLIAACDADCVLAPQWLEVCLSFFNDSAVIGVGGKLTEDGTASYANQWRKYNLIQHFGDEKKVVSYLSGSNTLFRKEVLMSNGLYDSARIYNHEDIDFCERLSESNGKLMYTPAALAAHIKEDTWYSVMATCWRVRHRKHPKNVIELCRDIFREARHGISIMVKDVLACRFQLFFYDASYFFIQTYFCVSAYFSKTSYIM